MNFVPLKLGVKVRTDQEYFTEEAIAHYKKRALDIMKETLIKNFKEQ